MSDLLVVFGATGTTGRHIVPAALDKGLRVRCYVRTPTKVPAELRTRVDVEIVEGVFEDAAAVASAVQGAQAVVCVGGGPSTFRPGMNISLTRAVVEGMLDHSVERVVFQSGALSPPPGRTNPPFVRWVLRPLLGTLARREPMLEENDRAMAWVAEQAPSLAWTFTRPGQIVDEASRGTLRPSPRAGAKCSAVDLARLTVELATSHEHVHDFPCVDY